MLICSTKTANVNLITEIAKRLKSYKVSQELLKKYLEVLNNDIAKQSRLSEEEILQIVNNTNDYELPIPSKVYDNSERGIAERLIDLFGDDIRFCEKINTWYTWNGLFWTDYGSTSRLTHMAELVIDIIKDSALKAQKSGNEREFKTLNQLYQRYSQINNIDNLIRYASRSCQIDPDQFDKNEPFLLNTLSGIVDLRTGELLPHDRKFMMSKIAPVFYDPIATCPRWNLFLKEVFEGDQELIKYLQEAIGYCLTGDVGEEIFFYFYGPTGRNGKSKFINPIMTLLGNNDNGYATILPSSALTANKFESGSFNIAKLKSKRFVTSSETDRNKQFSAALIKQLSGGDIITARTLYQKPFDFKPTIKLIISGNYQLSISGSDSAFFSRLKVIPFTVRFSDAQQDPDLENKLLVELPGILNWAVVGSIRWWNNRQKGISSLKQLPAKVAEATIKYQEDMDELGPFFSERLTIAPGNKIELAVLYELYQRFCFENEIKALIKKNFNQLMRSRGFTDKKSNGKVYWNGVGLKADTKEGKLKVV